MQIIQNLLNEEKTNKALEAKKKELAKKIEINKSLIKQDVLARNTMIAAAGLLAGLLVSVNYVLWVKRR